MKKIISIFLTFIMLLSCAPSFAMEDGAKTESIILGETFNDVINGDTPDDVFTVKRAGSGDMAVVPKPDAKNKSLRLTCGVDGTAYIEKAVNNPENAPLTLSFKMMLENLESFSLVNVVDSDGSVKPILTIENGSIVSGETIAATLEKGRWYYVEVSFNVKDRAFSLSLDNKKLIKKKSGIYRELKAVRFQLSATKQELCLDDITMYRADMLTGEREYYPGSLLYLDNILQDEAEDIASSGLLMYQNSDRAVKNGVELALKTPPVSVNKVIYAPIRFTAENLGGEVTWNAEEKAAFLIFGGKNYKLLSDSATINCDGVTLELTHKILNIGGTMYIAVDDITKIMNVPLYTELGFIMIDGEEELYKNAVDLVKNEVKNMVKYPRPNADELYNALMTRYPNNAHPRLQGSAQDFERMKNLVATDDLFAKMYNYLKMSADAILGQPTTKWAATMNKEDETVEDRLKILSFVYRMSGDKKYADRAWQEAEAVCAWGNWHALNDALACTKVLRGFAYAYDWLYDYLTDEQRTFIATNMKEKAMDALMDAFVGKITRENNRNWAWWIGDPLNFNTNNNYAILAAAVALAEVYPEYCADMMAYAVRSLEVHFNVYEPDGAWIEGPDYGHQTLNSGVSIINLLAAAFGTDCGFGTAVGLTEAAYYYQYILGPTGFFNYSDAGKQTKPEYAFSFLLADYLQDTDLGYFRKKGLEKSNYVTRPEELFTYNAALIGESAKSLPIDQYFRTVEVATLRSSWDDSAIFAGLHSDYNRQEHGHLDMGTFVLDANGEEWFCDHRYDPYLYSHMTYTTYRTRAEGHSTLIIDDTPYTLSATEGDEGGYLNYKNYDFEDYEAGETLALSQDATTEFRIIYSGLGSMDVVEDPDNKDNKYLYMTGSKDKDALGHSAYQLNFPEPIKSGIEYSFRMKFEDFEDFVDTSNHNGSFPEVGSSLGSATSAGFYHTFTVNSSGKLSVRTKTVDRVLLDELKPDVWYTFTMRAELDKKTLSVSVDGGEEGGSASLSDLTPRSELPDIKYFRFNSNTNLHVDDITLKIHPSEREMALTAARRYDQYMHARACIDKFESKDRGAYAITDISEAYPQQAESAVRGIMLGENRTAVIVRDEVKLKKKSDIYWFGQMRAAIDVEIAEDGKSAIMSQNGKKLWVGIISDGDYEMKVMDATPLPGAPNPSEQLPNTDIKRLAIIARGVMDMNLSVALIPLGAGEIAPAKIPEAVALADWSIPDGEMPKLTSLTVDGKLIDGFEANKTFYNLMLYDEQMNTVPQIAATADAGAEVTIQQATKIPGSATVTVTKDSISRSYQVNIDGKKLMRATIRGKDVTELDVTASGYETEDSAPMFILDGDITTRWCSFPKNQWIQIDFKDVITLSDLQIAWYQGSERNYAFQIQVSENGTNWQTAYEGYSSGNSEELETFAFDKSYNTRFVKVICNGHAKGDYNNISEIR